MQENQQAQNETLKSPPDLIGGRYEIIQYLGEGAMGTLVKARHHLTGRLVAVKILKGFQLSDKARQRFQLEAQAACKFDHPNSVSVLDFDFDQYDRPFLVMEYLEGEPLSDLLARREFLSEAEVVELVKQLCSVLQAAHSIGVIHRDLKPSNIVVQKHAGGRLFVKIIDFGIAKITQQQSVTTTGEIIGSPAYLAPELCSGMAATAASDIYSLGTMMYELLSGKLPFEGNNIMHLMHLKSTQTAVPVAESNPRNHVSEHMSALVMKAMSCDPARRYQSASELLADLDATYHAQPAVGARDVRISRFSRTSYILISAFALIVLVLGSLWWLNRPINKSLPAEQESNPVPHIAATKPIVDTSEIEYCTVQTPDLAQLTIDQLRQQADTYAWTHGATLERVSQYFGTAFAKLGAARSEDERRVSMLIEYAMIIDRLGARQLERSCLQRALHMVSAELLNPALEVQCWQALSVVDRRDNVSAAVKDLDRAMQVTNRLPPDASERLSVYYELGGLYSAAGAQYHDKARQAYATFRKLAASSPDQHTQDMRTFTYQYEALMAEDERNYAEAVRLARKVLPVMEEERNKVWLPGLKEQIARCERHLK